MGMNYILGSSENFNQSIQTMYIKITELGRKLSYNLLKIIHWIDETDVRDDNLKDLAEINTDILLNLYLNTNPSNLSSLIKEEIEEVFEENDIEESDEEEEEVPITSEDAEE